MSDDLTTRCRVIRGFLVSIGRDAVVGDLVDLPREFAQLMRTANAVEFVPDAVAEAAAPTVPTETETKPAKGK